MIKYQPDIGAIGRKVRLDGNRKHVAACLKKTKDALELLTHAIAMMEEDYQLLIKHGDKLMERELHE